MKRRRNLFSSFTLWLIVLGVVAWALQANPITGIVLVLFGIGDDINLWLIGAIVIGFILDCLIGPIPLIALPLPFLAAGGYAAWYKLQYDADHASLPQIAAELSKRDTAPLAFDPATQALDAIGNDLLLHYAISAVYNTHLLAGSTRFGIKPLHDCKPTADDADPGEMITGDFMAPNSLKLTQWCLTHVREVTTLPTVALDDSTATETIAGKEVQISIRTATSGAQTATAVQGRTQVLPPWPKPLIGCYLIDQPSSWQCGISYVREFVDVESGAPADHFDDNALAARLLSLKPRSPDEIAALTAP